MLVDDLRELLQKEITDSRVRFVPFEISDIEVEERVRLKCMIPPCPNYGRSKFCPPNLPDLNFIRAALAKYQGGLIVVLTIPYNEEVIAEIKQNKPQNELMKILGECEKVACEQVNHLSFALTVGGCKLCKECAPAGEPCRYPLQAHPGITGFGIDITTVARKLGIKVEWPVKSNVNFLGMLFI